MNNTTRLSRRSLLGGAAALAGAALLAACGGSNATATSAATKASGAATTGSGAATTGSGAATTASGSATTGSSAATTGSGAATTAGGAATTTSASATRASTAVGTTASSSSVSGTTTTGAASTPSSTAAVSSTTAGVSGTTTSAGGSAVAGMAGGTAIASVKLTGTIKLATKDFTEEFIVGQMYKMLLEQAGAKVDYKQSLGGTPVVQAAMEKGDVELYPEYTGTGLATVLKQPTTGLDAKQTYDQVSKGYADKYKFVWLDPAPMNDTQALAMTQQGSQKFGVTTISQMVAKASDLTMIGPAEFQEREDGIPGIMKTYGNFKLKSYIAVDPGLKYQGLLQGKADVSVAFGTDGDIAANNLIVLKDDKNLFPISQITPVITQKALDANPGVKTVLNALSALITDQVASRLNNEVDGKKREPADVAKEFLQQSGLLKK